MDELYRLKQYLEASIKKNGDKPLTMSHLLNIIKCIEKDYEREEKNDIMHDFDTNQ